MPPSTKTLIDAKRLSSMKPGAAAERTIRTPHIARLLRPSKACLFRNESKNVARVLLDNQPPEHVVQ
jgi:phosphoglycerate dehydrogenase-like enzyme